MEKVTLPDGEYPSGEKIYIVKDGEVIEVKEATKPQEMAEEMSPAQDAQPAPSISEEEILILLQPKFDEIYAAIADLKNLIESDTEEDEEEYPAPVKTEMGINQRFASAINFLKN